MKTIYIIFSIVLLSTSLSASTFEVGPGKPYQTPGQVTNLVKDGDSVLIEPGTYQEEVTWTRNNLLIRGVSRFAHMTAPAVISNKKAIWVITGNNNVIENIEFSEAKVPDKNGAGIRMEGTNLKVSHCFFHNCENGILCGRDTNSTIWIEFSEFAYCGYGDGYSHNLYIGNIQKLIFRFNYSHHANVGHCLKSRAFHNYIYYNRITDETDGNSSYLINLPNGGVTSIFGNSLMQGPNAENSKMIDYGSEGYSNPEHLLSILNNTLINKRNPGIFISVANGGNLLQYQIRSNIFAGYSAFSPNAFPLNASDTLTNYRTIDIASLYFLDEPNYDYHLTDKSPVIDIGSLWGGVENYYKEYKHKCDSALIEYDKVADIGAYQFVKPTDISDDNKTPIYVSNGKLIFNSSGSQFQTSRIKIYGVTGKCLYQSDKAVPGNEIEVSFLPHGIYFINYFADKKEENQKFYILK